MRKPVTQSDITHNARRAVYPDHVEFLIASKPVFREDGWECINPRKRSKLADDDEQGHDVERARRRARRAVRDYALCNGFDYFVTLTLDQTRVDRYDSKAVIQKLNRWADNHVRRHGLKYILVPELHKDGAIHFHGFFNDALAVSDSGHTDANGHQVFNLPQWTLGFTTAIRLYGEYERAVSYVCKYISKQTEKIGGRWYYSGGQLASPEYELFDWTFGEIPDGVKLAEVYSFEVKEAGAAFMKYSAKL